MKLIAITALAAAATVALAGCTPQQTAQAQTIVASACAVASVASVVIATDGTIVGTTAAQNTKIAEGQQLVTVNCAATQAGIAALAAAQVASPTALVAEENQQAPKIGISQSLLHKIVKHYTGK